MQQCAITSLLTFLFFEKSFIEIRRTTRNHIKAIDKNNNGSSGWRLHLVILIKYSLTFYGELRGEKIFIEDSPKKYKNIKKNSYGSEISGC